MTKQIIAIGGGGFGRDPGKGIIENYILEQAKIKKPNICFIDILMSGLLLIFVINFISS